MQILCLKLSDMIDVHMATSRAQKKVDLKNRCTHAHGCQHLDDVQMRLALAAA
jgi:hypothetical protein